MRREPLLVFAACALLGCANADLQRRDIASPPREAPGESGPSHIAAALDYFRRLQPLDREALREEYLRTAAEFARTQELGKRIELVLLLSDERCECRDPEAALRLLDGYTAHLPDPSVADFLSLLASRLEAQRVYEREARRQSGRALQLQQQLDALRSIERQIQAREAPERMP